MRRRSILCVLAVLAAAWMCGSGPAEAQAVGIGSDAPLYRVPVDEVNLTFHAVDAHGLPVNDLVLDELRLLDNGKAPRRILAYDSLQDRAIRAGLLIDTSKSMEQDLPGVRAIALQYAQKMFRQQTDQAFVMDFGSTS